jgi:isopenicillin-N epimerase
MPQQAWFRGRYQQLLKRARASLASYINAPASDVVFVENASDGINAIVRSLPPHVRSKVMILSTAYSMVKHTVNAFCQCVVTCDISFPVLSPREVTAAVIAGLKQHQPQLLIVSHITSVPSVILPVKEICSAAASFSCRVLVDGAHALGQIPIDIQQLNPHYYVANCHKWMLCCRGSGLLYARPDIQGELLPTVMSSNGPASFEKMFEYTGTKDYTPHLSIIAALNFRAQFGEAQLQAYVRALSIEGGKLLAASWNTECIAPDEMTGSGCFFPRESA